jgi:hypothetical protein
MERADRCRAGGSCLLRRRRPQARGRRAQVRRRGHQANVTQLVVGYPVDAGTQTADLMLLEAEDRFLRESGLQAARPGVRLRCLSERSYAELLQAVKAHGHDLMRERESLLPPEEIAASWYDCD